MALAAGIVGLPNVGKSSLFNTITKLSILVENYPFATIEPNVGVVNLPDERLDQLAKIFQPQKVIPATFKFVDIAGLVKGAAQGEGLGNKFLANIRDVDAICHVVRCFDDRSVIHTSNQVDAVYDAQVIDLELIYADLAVVQNAYNRLPKKMGNSPKAQIALDELLTKVVAWLKQDQPVRNLSLNEHERQLLSSYNLLTIKPILYVANINDDQAYDPELNQQYLALKAYAQKNHSLVIPLAIRLENELAQLDEHDAQELLTSLNLTTSGFNKLIQSAFKLLNLGTYFTCGKQEVHAWPFQLGMKAPECAGIIHTDFAKGFIRAEVMKSADLITYQSEALVKQHGKLSVEGKDYVVQDGDVCHFRFNV